MAISRTQKVTVSCQQLVDEICPCDGEALLTQGQFNLLSERLVPAVIDSVPEGLYFARLDLERSAAAAIKKVFSGKVVPDPSDGRLSFVARAKSLVAGIRRSASRA